MALNHFLKETTEQVVSYLEKPKEVRKATRRQKKETRLPLFTYLFGMLPFALKLFWQGVKRKK